MLWAFFDRYWLWLTFPLFFMIIVASHEIDYRVGADMRARRQDDKDESLGDLTGSAIGLPVAVFVALVCFLIADLKWR